MVLISQIINKNTRLTMPLREDKWKALLADLGRPTLRGIRKCPKCGTVNGTRGNSCKNKTCDVVFRGNGPRKKASTDASQISNLPGCKEKVYSVRLRDRGPDYRNFVQISSTEDSRDSLSCPEVVSSCDTEAKCCVDTCNRNKQQFPCSHILTAQRCILQSQELPVKHSVMSGLNIPNEHIEMLSHLINEFPHLMVQRVSKTSFVVKCQPNSRHPLGFLHVMFIKSPKNDSSVDKKCLCSCRPFKLQNRETEIIQSNSPDRGNQMCLHYYACICAFASSESLTTEFEHFISQAAHEFSPPLLNQLQLVSLPQSNDGKSVELDPTQISVEIMRENISLLESIAAADDSTLANVQGLEGVLSDQIIVTNVDDSLAFGDPAVLDGLDDPDQQVCQIFANAQNTIQLATFTTQSENHVHNLEIATAVQTSSSPTEQPTEDQYLIKRKKDNRNSTHFDLDSSSIQSSTIPSYSKFTASSRTSLRNATITCMTQAATPTPEEQQLFLPGFENWLAGVNDRINATMNYQLPPNPEPLIYYVPSEYFECLKDRISTGGKKKRLPNQTLVFHRTDRAPLGTYTKHIWKITNILHIIHIFGCSMVPLKTKQYFFKTSSGNYVEWIPPRNEDEKNQRIFPVLHSTFLKCGRNHESTTKESVPFVIEWIPEIFRESKMGELSIRFEFGRNGPDT